VSVTRGGDPASDATAETSAVPRSGVFAELEALTQRWWWPPTLLQWASAAVMGISVAIGILLTLTTVIGRITSISALNLQWSDEAGVVMLNILCFIGGAVGYRQRRFTSLDLLDRNISSKFVAIVGNARDAVTLAVCGDLAYIAWGFATNTHSEDQYLHVSEMWVYIPLPIGMGLLALFCLERIMLSPAGKLSGIALAVGLMAVLQVLHVTVWNSADATTCMVVALVVAAGLLFGGLGLPFAFGAGSLIFLYFQHLPFVVTASDLVDSNASFLLVSIPFFLLVGYLMSESNLSDKLADVLQIVLGRVPGGVLHAVLVSMLIFSGISGSKIGDMAAIGKSAVRMAKKEDYEVSEAVAALCAGGSMGDTVPPALTLIVLSSVSSISVGALFIGGIVPAFVCLAVMMAIIVYRFRKHPRQGTPMSWAARGKVILSAVPVMVIPVILVGGIVTGLATPTEISAVAVALTILLITVIYRSASWMGIVRATVNASVLAGVVLTIVAFATLFARVLTLAEVPQQIANLVADGDVGGHWGFMALTAVVMIIMGMIMEGLPSILVFAPILVPIALNLGINPVYYGIVMVMAVGIGTHSPPIGVALYVGAEIGDVPVKQVGRKMRSYLVALYVALIIVIAAPVLVTWLPTAFHVK
jgi:tripartite ATP-independent transporter DctM subunit